MKKTLLRTLVATIAFAFVIGCGGSGDDDNSSDSRPDRDACDSLGLKIINGTECKIESSPVVAILTDEGSCTGFLATSTSVVTAAHCFCDPGSCSGGYSAQVVVSGRETLTSSAVAVHPSYRIIADERSELGKLQNDVAVITIPETSAGRTLPIYTGSALQVGSIVGIFGYGKDENGNTGFNGILGGDGYHLDSGEMEISSLRDELIEAAYSGEGSNTCVGDSGGPMTFESPAGGVGAVGVTSIGIAEPGKLCQPGEISVFTDLRSASVLRFLREKIPGLPTL